MRQAQQPHYAKHWRSGLLLHDNWRSYEERFWN
jgi:hypothetical protein